MNKIFFLPLAKQLAERRPKNFEASCQDTLCTYVSKSRSRRSYNKRIEGEFATEFSGIGIEMSSR